MLREAIEATRLGPGVMPRDIDQLCDDALKLGVRGVCVPPLFAAKAADRLKDTGLLTVSVAGFPHGDATPEGLSAEISALAAAGAAEIDVVAPLGLALAGEWGALAEILSAVGEATRRAGVRWKAILETALFAEETIVRVAEEAVAAGAGWLKTSTGFHVAGGASEEAVRLLRQIAPQGVGVKASGGIRDRATACQLLEAGADRIGTSAARAILEG